MWQSTHCKDEQYKAWQGGADIQDAAPQLSPDDRELLISGKVRLDVIIMKDTLIHVKYRDESYYVCSHKVDKGCLVFMQAIRLQPLDTIKEWRVYD